MNKQSIIQRKRGNLLPFVIRNKALIILVVIMVALMFMTDKFLTFSNLINVVRQNCAGIVLGIGFTYVIAAGCIDLSVGTMIGLIGVVSGMMSKTSMPFVLVVLLTLLLGAFLGACNGAFSIGIGIQPFIVTLAMQSVFKGVNYLLCNNTAVTNVSDSYTFVGQGYIGPIPFQIYLMVLMVVAGIILMERTKFGRHCLAIGGNAGAASVCGINVKKTKFMVFVLVGICASVAAMITTGRAAAAQPTAGQGMEMDVIAAVVIGGTPLSGGEANVFGTLIGCLIVGIINNGLNLMKVDSNWQIVAKGLLILVAVAFDIFCHRVLSRRLKKSTN